MQRSTLKRILIFNRNFKFSFGAIYIFFWNFFFNSKTKRYMNLDVWLPFSYISLFFLFCFVHIVITSGTYASSIKCVSVSMYLCMNVLATLCAQYNVQMHHHLVHDDDIEQRNDSVLWPGLRYLTQLCARRLNPYWPLKTTKSWKKSQNCGFL